MTDTILTTFTIPGERRIYILNWASCKVKLQWESGVLAVSAEDLPICAVEPGKEGVKVSAVSGAFILKVSYYNRDVPIPLGLPQTFVSNQLLLVVEDNLKLLTVALDPILIALITGVNVTCVEVRAHPHKDIFAALRSLEEHNVGERHHRPLRQVLCQKLVALPRLDIAEALWRLVRIRRNGVALIGAEIARILIAEGYANDDICAVLTAHGFFCVCHEGKGLLVSMVPLGQTDSVVRN